jgi:hypothetical protein
LQRDIGFSTDCICGCTQLIWILGVQKFVLFVMDNMLGVLEDCIYRIIGVSIRFMAPTTEVAPRASQASRERGVVWQAGKA